MNKLSSRRRCGPEKRPPSEPLGFRRARRVFGVFWGGGCGGGVRSSLCSGRILSLHSVAESRGKNDCDLAVACGRQRWSRWFLSVFSFTLLTHVPIKTWNKRGSRIHIKKKIYMYTNNNNNIEKKKNNMDKREHNGRWPQWHGGSFPCRVRCVFCARRPAVLICPYTLEYRYCICMNAF